MLITVEDAQNRAEFKLKRAVEEVKKLLVPAVSNFHHLHLLIKNGLLYVSDFIYFLACVCFS